MQLQLAKEVEERERAERKVPVGLLQPRLREALPGSAAERRAEGRRRSACSPSWPRRWKGRSVQSACMLACCRSARARALLDRTAIARCWVRGGVYQGRQGPTHIASTAPCRCWA